MYIDTATANSRSARPQIVISPSRNDGSSPLVENFIGQHADAPPSYLEATTPGLYTSRQSGEEGARLLSFDGREPRDAALKEDQYAQQSLWKRCTRSPWFRLFAAVITLLLIILMMALMAAAVSIRRDQQDAAAATRPSAQPAEAEPTLSGTGVFHGDDDTEGPQIITVPWPSSVAQPDANRPTPVASPQPSQSGATQSQGDDEDSTKPDLIAIPWPSHSAAAQPPASADTAQTFPIRWPSKCGKGYNVKTEWYDFGKPSDLHIQEAVHQLDGSYKRVAGWVHIAPAPADQAPGSVKVKMSYAISSTVNIDSVKYSRTPSGLVIGDPSFPDGFDGVRSGKACLGMSVTIYVAPGATMKTLKVSSNHMGMQIHHGSNFTVTDSTTISLTTGTLDAITFDSRQTYLKTISGSISGKFALRDLLSIVTKSGSVNIDIQPQEALPGSNNPAVFMVDSLSGSIRTDFKRKRIPERDYQTYINTTVGSVGGSFIHGSRTEMNSIAGLITADILPFKSGNYQSEIYTQTHSGQTELVLHSPYKAKNMPMSGLVSTHKSTSGGLDVTYPTEWTGHIDGTSLSGALHLQGKELELLNENDNPGQNHVEAKKGNGESSLSFDTVSGECEIKVGRV